MRARLARFRARTALALVLAAGCAAPRAELDPARALDYSDRTTFAWTFHSRAQDGRRPDDQAAAQALVFDAITAGFLAKGYERSLSTESDLLLTFHLRWDERTTLSTVVYGRSAEDGRGVLTLPVGSLVLDVWSREPAEFLWRAWVADALPAPTLRGPEEARQRALGDAVARLLDRVPPRKGVDR